MAYTQAELRSKSTTELISELIKDDANGYPLRQELNKRFVRGDDMLNNIHGVSKPPNHHTNYRTTTATSVQQAKQAIVDVLEGRRVYAHACKAILNTNWDCVDHAGMMQKPPDEVRDFLKCCSFEAGMYNDMFATRRNLLKMIFDAFMRAHGGYSNS